VAKPSVAVDPSAPASSPTAVIEARPTSPPTAPATAPVAPFATPSAPATSAPAPQNTSATAVEEPRLQVQVVVYSDVPAQRMVFIDGRRYAEGDKVDAETVVERITPEGAVVTRRGQRFPLTSGRP
jgi:pyruvate/2-oxoglutarate dehydrogenase complex dihydrolipoamide acyltransferase (E2) component